MLRQLSFILVFTALISTQAQEFHPAQGADTDRKARGAQIEKLRIDHGAGDWKKVPVDVLRQTDLCPDSRQARDAYWRKSLPSTSAILSLPTFAALSPELPSIPDTLLVVGTFVGHQTFEPEPDRGAYTEISFAVETTIGHSSVQPPVSPGTTIYIDETGGTIVDNTGVPRQYYTDLDPYPMQPNHKYLLMLRPHEPGDFYTVLRKWDVSNGTALPAGRIEASAFLDNRSEISGKPLPVIVSKLSSSR